MRQVIRLLLTLLAMLTIFPSFAAYQGKIDYMIPIDYTQLNQAELEEKAEFYYNRALKTYNDSINDEVTSALNLYTILTKKCPENQLYPVKLGYLYDITGHDRLAKSCFFQAMGIDTKKPLPYFYLGEFYYRRQSYKNALKFYKRAYDNGYSENYDTLYKIGDIYEKFGDTKASLKYLNVAAKINTNSDLEHKIERIKVNDAHNKTYYTNSKMREN